MFKGFQKGQLFKSFPNLNFQVNNEAYGFSGCTFWLDAASGTNTQTDLAAVSSWKDKITGAEFVQATAANQPQFVLNDANFNNYPSVRCQDNARFMLSSNLGLNFSKFGTLAIVFKVDTANNANTILSINNGSSPYLVVNAGGNAASWTGLGLYAFVSAETWYQGTTESTVSRIAIISNNYIIVNGVTENSTLANLQIDNATLRCLFRYANNGLLNLIGRISEIVYFNTSLNESRMLELSNRLNSKYAIY